MWVEPGFHSNSRGEWCAFPVNILSTRGETPILGVLQARRWSHQSGICRGRRSFVREELKKRRKRNQLELLAESIAGGDLAALSPSKAATEQAAPPIRGRGRGSRCSKPADSEQMLMSQTFADTKGPWARLVIELSIECDQGAPPAVSRRCVTVAGMAKSCSFPRKNPGNHDPGRGVQSPTSHVFVSGL